MESDDARLGTASRAVTWALLFAGLIGTLASTVLVVERIELLQNPDYVPSCSIGPILSCGSVMQSWQASAFGISNPIIGVATFPVVFATGLALLAGARMAAWYWWGLLLGSLSGVVFTHWLAWQSLYDIGALCPYCMVAWVAAMVALLATASQLARAGRLPRFLASYAPSIMFGWVALMLLLIFLRFSDYWLSLI